MTESRVGVVTHWFNKIGVATVRLEAPLAVGDRIHFLGGRDDFFVRVRSMQVNHAPVERAAPGQEVGIKVGKKAHQGDVVLRAEGKPGLMARLLRWMGG